jgi:hypothetical protein
MLLALCNQRFLFVKNFYVTKVCRLSCYIMFYVAIIVNRIAYCLSAWGEFLTEVCKACINAVFKRAKRFGFTDTVYDLNGLREHADEFLFNQIQSDFHCLHHILPPIKPDCTYLRARGHDYIFYRSLTRTCIDHHLCRDVCIIICNRFAIYF